MPAPEATFGLPREATIQLNDVYGPIPVDGLSIPPPDDFDAKITSQVRNTGHFSDGEYAISDGGTVLGSYGLVLIDDLRHQQHEQAGEILDRLGATDISQVNAEQRASLHPDDAVRLGSLETSVVAVVNEAARTAEHHTERKNGRDFYAAVTTNGLEAYVTPVDVLAGLDARGRIAALYRIPDGVVWPDGEQFRSSIASDARRQAGVLEPVPRDENWPIPPLPDGVRVAFADKFGNVRLETSDIAKHGEVLSESELVDLTLEDGRVALSGLHVVTRLTEVPEGEVGIYINPADKDADSGPAYFELVRRVSKPNGDTEPRAYHVLSEHVGGLLGKEIKLSDWNDITFDIVPTVQPQAA